MADITNFDNVGKEIESLPVFKKIVKDWEDFVDLRADIEVDLGRKLMSVKEFLNLQIGSVLRLNKSAGESVDIYVNGSYFGKGEITVIESTFGIRITDVYDPREL
jgi:flagellar motor switch protein FliN/FliY